MASAPALSHLTNPLATVEQLATSASQLNGVPADLEISVRYAATRLIQAAGILLELPQDVIATAVVYYLRCWVGPDGCSLKQHSARDVASASLYLAAKLSAYPQTPRNVINGFATLIAYPALLGSSSTIKRPEPASYVVSEGTYIARRNVLMKMETLVLRACGFQTHVALPYTLAVNYMQALDSLSGAKFPQRTFQHLNSCLQSPQLLYLTHQPTSLAVAAIYLAARETEIALPEGEWWEVFDTDREELGFLVVAMCSMKGFAEDEGSKWNGSLPPLTTQDVEAALVKRAEAEE